MKVAIHTLGCKVNQYETAALETELRRRGHEVTGGDPINFGRGQIIWRDEQGVLCGGTEPRADGCVAAW